MGTEADHVNTPAVSIVVEWENRIKSGAERSRRMLESLKGQFAGVAGTGEAIFVFNPADVDPEELTRFLARHLEGAPFPYAIESADAHYYELKNRGAARARGEVLVFVDSDVIPEPGWLAALVGTLKEHPEIQALAGNSYIRRGNFYEKAFASGWFFPFRVEAGRLEHIRWQFHANNVAFRRALFDRFPFPPMPPGAGRGSCFLLGKQLAAQGYSMWIQTGARVEHPAPRIRNFPSRSLASGRDEILIRKTQVKASGWVLFQSSVRVIWERLARVLRERRGAGLAPWETPLALGVMGAFYSLHLAGVVITLARPGYARSHWRI